MISPVLSEQLDKTIKGTVIGHDGFPIPGVTIIIKDTNKGVVTDLEGKYTLKEVPNDAILVFSYLGMISQEVSVTDKSVIDITMKDDLSELNEVVVVGYGKQDKISVTGSVASIKTEEIKRSPSPNIVGALTGQLSGLTTVQNNGRPGSEDYSIYLRGVSTTNNSSPLILIDGVPRDNLTELDPNEVESVTVLKDASSTAVFGVRGANGVILVTTRQGSSKELNVSYTYEFGLQHLIYKADMMDSWDYAAMRNQALINDGYEPQYSDRQIGLMKSGTSPLYPNTDWYGIMMRDFAPMHRHNLNMSGGNDRFKYFFNVGYLNQKSFYEAQPEDEIGYDPEYSLTRYNFRSNMDLKVNDWISAGVKMGGYVNTTGGTTGSASNIYYGINDMNALTPGPITDASWKEYGALEGIAITPENVSNTNPYALMNFKGYNTQEKNNFSSTAFLDFDLGMITKGLSTKFMASFDTYSTSTLSASKSFNSYQYKVTEEETLQGDVYDAVSFTPESDIQLYTLSLSKSSGYYFKANYQWLLNYDRTFNNIHKVTGMVLAQRDNQEEALAYNYLGVAARGTYMFKNKYMAEANLGYNGSEQFAEGNRFGFFPAGSLGWVVSNEPFMESVDFISKLKFRASYGKVGSDKIGGNRFLYQDAWNITTSGNINTISDYAAYETLIGNPGITWEVAYKQNYGMELGLFNNDLSLSVDVFREKRENILLTRETVSDAVGLSGIYPKVNAGIVENKGFEIELGYRKRITNDFTFANRSIFSYAKNNNVFSDEAIQGEDYNLRYESQGHPLNSNVGYLVDWESEGNGYYISQEEINLYSYASGTPRLGDLKYKDLNNDGVIGPEDKDIIGFPTIPQITYSSTFNFDYKGFNLSLMFQGVAQVTKSYGIAGIYEYGEPGSYNDFQRNSWTQERWDNGQPISAPALSAYTASSSHTENDYYNSDISYVRLKTAELGYNFSKSVCDKLSLKRLRVYTNGSNLITWTNSRFTHLDPEAFRAHYIPIAQIFNFGLNVTF
ncbi:SusC/RagA family TonB-linked outer membrane protein [Formosa undariae]|uniref:SusC/RagA family TonB-linked outer membrane protein n=1 Tax=Formosa undariae TaxID=1325436 RepID=A0ABV5F5E1_9FLAO